ncbi:MAG TPA: protein translocase subunit SecD [Kiritimatiellia bacterium]|nr:protein translocase subunit SecD [Kiritimatiellia bacterium]HMO97666.1 protein translocase subunit SecD [Kiritimatiellia bacterium]HMP95527.1 protein translocase subunit SecD [Kiritimatiellia bacterium]
MDKNVKWKWLALALLILSSLMLVTPVSQKVKLGLDLQGGISFIVQIDEEQLLRQYREENRELTEEQAVRDVRERVIQSQDIAVEVIRGRVDTIGIAEPSIYPKGENRIIVQLPGVDEDKQREARDSIMSVAFLEFRLVHENSDTWVRELFQDGKAPRGFRVGSATDFFFVRDFEKVSEKEMDRQFWSDLRRFAPRPRSDFMLMRDERQGATIYRPFYIETRRQLTGDALKDAKVEYGQFNEPRISLEFNTRGARDFARVTKDYGPNGEKNMGNDEGRQLAIVLDGTLYSAPVIRTAILDGRAEITGMFSPSEAARLVNVLRAGSLPVPVVIIEERQVSPSLGHDSIESGVKAAMYGGTLVFVFMIMYYRLAGVIAVTGLGLIMLLLPLGMWISAGFLSTFAGGGEGGRVGLPVITLPGIAGIVLTIGMAVDAAVLIFERMREELTNGKSLGAAIQAGYEKAFSAILDANVTTVITAIILFWQGSGPVRGFAVTLCAGIIISMIVSLIYMKMFLRLLVDKFGMTTLNMLHWVKATSVDFLGKRKIYAVLATLLIVGSMTNFVIRGEQNFGVDFTGGTVLVFRFDQEQPIDQVRAVLDQAGIGGAQLQYQQDIAVGPSGDYAKLLEVKVGYEQGDQARDLLLESFREAGFNLAQTERVGPQVGDELKRSGMIAMIAALIGIIIYITIRFEFAFAMGAIVATIHDVLLTVGLFSLFGKQFSLPIIAALLTIVGYSVNDTIVVFDRIREDLKLMRGKKFVEICNISINQTLSRTILTSFTTLLTVGMLLIFGGGAMNDFALTMFIGIIVGTLSTIYVATPIMLLWYRDKPSESEKAKA